MRIMLLQRLDTVLADLRILETQLGGGTLHLGLIFTDYLIHAAFQQTGDLGDVG